MGDEPSQLLTHMCTSADDADCAHSPDPGLEGVGGTLEEIALHSDLRVVGVTVSNRQPHMILIQLLKKNTSHHTATAQLQHSSLIDTKYTMMM